MSSLLWKRLLERELMRGKAEASIECNRVVVACIGGDAQFGGVPLLRPVNEGLGERSANAMSPPRRAHHHTFKLGQRDPAKGGWVVETGDQISHTVLTLFGKETGTRRIGHHSLKIGRAMRAGPCRIERVIAEPPIIIIEHGIEIDDRAYVTGGCLSNSDRGFHHDPLFSERLEIHRINRYSLIS